MIVREKESAGLGASGVRAAHLRDPRSRSHSTADEFDQETEFKLTDLYRKPSLSTYESERKRECGTGGFWSEIQETRCLTSKPCPAEATGCMDTGRVACVLVSGAGVCRGCDVPLGGRSALAEPASSDRQQGAAYKVSPALFTPDTLLGV